MSASGSPGATARRDHEADERETRIERVRERFTRARTRSEAAAEERPLCFRLKEALWVAQDLYMLGCIPVAPTLAWGPAEAEEALSRWDACVCPEPEDLAARVRVSSSGT